MSAQSFDTVIVNEVVQYFPSVDYLMRVLAAAIEATAPGGRIFVGGVRSLPLLRAFRSSVELARAPAELPVRELARRAEQSIVQEKELVVDPALFGALVRHLPRVAGVSLDLKGGRSDDELTRYRYDVVVWLDEAPAQPRKMVRLDARRTRLDLEELGRQLAAGNADVLVAAELPNARLAGDLALVELLGRADLPPTAEELRQAVAQSVAERDGFHPEDLRQLGAEHGFEVSVSWARSGDPGGIEAVFRRRDAPVAPAAKPGRKLAAPVALWRRYGNDPLRSSAAERLLPRIKTFLTARLPEYMVPGDLVLLDALPLSGNGKIDRRALARFRLARCRGRAQVAPHAFRRDAGGSMGPGPRPRPGRNRRRLLRPRRSLATRNPARFQGARHPGARVAPEGGLRASDGGRSRRLGRSRAARRRGRRGAASGNRAEDR